MQKKAKLIIILLLFPLVSSAVSGQGRLGQERIYSLFQQANKAFKKANSAEDDSSSQKLYEKAILSYEKIINEGGIKNARLFYNLGNTYFLKGELGKAILNYRRARELDKSDLGIQKNLNFARSRRVDLIEENPKQQVLKTLFFWHYDFDLRTKFILTLVFFAGICITLTVMVWRGRSAESTVPAVICFILMICFLGSVLVEDRQKSRTIGGVIIAEEVVAHQADWKSSASSFKEPLHEGTEFELIERRPGWLHIKLADESNGWIPDKTAELI